jgi:hypothetical protein
LSRQLDGSQTGFNKKFGLMCLRQTVDEPEAQYRN